MGARRRPGSFSPRLLRCDYGRRGQCDARQFAGAYGNHLCGPQRKYARNRRCVGRSSALRGVPGRIGRADRARESIYILDRAFRRVRGAAHTIGRPRSVTPGHDSHPAGRIFGSRGTRSRSNATSCGIVLSAAAQDLFGSDAVRHIADSAFKVERASDRMGYRLSGPDLGGSHLGALPSAPMCVGAVQVPNGGQPIVLMPDGPTVGGYPVIGVVSTVSLATLAQLLPGEEVRFAPVSVETAQRSLKRMAVAIHTLQHLRGREQRAT
jgi:hypothetical protein